MSLLCRLRSAAFAGKNATRVLYAPFSTNLPQNGQKVLLTVNEAKSLPDFSKIDPVYDDVVSNESVIDLWKKNQAKYGVSGEHLNAIEKMRMQDRPPYLVYEPKRSDLVSEVDDLIWTKDLGIPFEQYRKLKKKVIHIRRVVQMTRKGKIPSMSALVVVGNGMGGAGYGEAKDSEVPHAVMKATREAIKRIRNIPLYDDRTIHHDIYHKFKATKIHFWARRPGFGCRVNHVIHEICDCIGLQDLAGKVRGSRNPLNVVKGTFAALATQQIPEDIARSRGLRLVDVNHIYYGGTK
ncbi:28S ribosomal protein S5, mitochondrial [Mycoemilia scoparia]|uniref:Small ribosomal subunit protein uS5m n=1 Tax=Mycoemilia scoparia TaxID=417184 RepID=A0A9W8A266_9FUNG|nr:28S ribosomal protein S5, mitochondrial [Mycoemilia scoparia]